MLVRFECVGNGFHDELANDSNPNYLYRNRGDGTFEEIGVLSGLGTNADGRAQAYMGMAVGDYDRNRPLIDSAVVSVSVVK